MAEIAFMQCSEKGILSLRLPQEDEPKGCVLVARIEVTDEQLAVLRDEIHWRRMFIYIFGYMYESAHVAGPMNIGNDVLEPLKSLLYTRAVEARTRVA
jgi:hypothetical protein